MRTLDEVIEIASDWTNGFDEMSIEKQMLHYLKEYRSDIKHWEADRKGYEDWIEQYKEARDRHQQAVIELKKNDPLTWDELKAMEGKPAWIEMNGYKPNWGIVMNQDKRNGRLMLCGYDKAAIRIEINKEGEGTVWKAYRKERK